jgi:DNA modification methylase
MKPYYQDEYVTLYCGDCREIVPTLGQFDLLLTDPPYGINYRKGKGDGRNPKWKSRHVNIPIYGDDKPFDPPPAIFQKMNIVWGGNNFASKLKDSKSWLVWDKRVDMKSNDFSDCEIAWTDIGCVARVFHHRWSGVIRDSQNGNIVLHPTEKPIALMTWCIALADKPTPVQTILDPYAGSGTTGVAAKILNRKCTLIEKEEKYCEIAARRLSQGVLPLWESEEN